MNSKDFDEVIDITEKIDTCKNDTAVSTNHINVKPDRFAPLGSSMKLIWSKSERLYAYITKDYVMGGITIHNDPNAVENLMTEMKKDLDRIYRQIADIRSLEYNSTDNFKKLYDNRYLLLLESAAENIRSSKLIEIIPNVVDNIITYTFRTVFNCNDVYIDLATKEGESNV